MTHLNDLSRVYKDFIAEKKDDSYLETDMKKRQKNNEKARKDMEKMGTSMKNPHFEEKRLDPVGREDADIDNDGDTDKSDKYLHKRRKAIAKAMKKRMSEGVRDEDPEKGTAERKARLEKKRGMKLDDHPEYKKEEAEVPSGDLKKLVKKAIKRVDADVDGDVDKDDPKEKGMGEFVPSADGKKRVTTSMGESFSNWRQDLSEVMGEGETEKKIKEKKVNNKIKINPNLGEAVEEIGGTLLEAIEIDEFDYAVESVYDELIEEGYTEDEVEYGIQTALNTLEEGYYDSAVASSKAAAAKNAGETPKRSMKDRLKSAAKKAIMGTARAAGKAMKAKATAQAAPGKASAKARSIAKRVKAIAKKGYESGRGPVEKKTTYRGAGVGRKEKIGEQASMSPQEVALQKRKANIDAMIARKRKQELSKKTEQPATAMGEAVNENVATGKARRAKFGGIAQKVGNSEVVTNKEKAATLEKHFAAKKAKEKAAGEAAHKAASAKGLSPAEAEMRRKAAERKAAKMRKEEVEQLDEMPYQVIGSPDGKKEKKIGKPVKSKKYADARAAELADTHKKTGGKYRSEYTEAAEDRLRDRRMERGGVDGNRRYDRPPARKSTNAELGIDPKAKTAAQKAAEAKYGKGASAMDIVKAQIKAKHGKGAIMDTKKKDK